MGHSMHQIARIRYDEPGRAPVLSRGALLRIARYFRPYLREALLITVCILATALLGLIPPLLVRDVIDHAIPNRDPDSYSAAIGGADRDANPDADRHTARADRHGHRHADHRRAVALQRQHRHDGRG